MKKKSKVFLDKYKEVFGVDLTPEEGNEILNKIIEGWQQGGGWEQKVNGKTFGQTYKPELLWIDHVKCVKVFYCPFCREVFGKEHSRHTEKEIVKAGHGLCIYSNPYRNSLRSREDHLKSVSGDLKETINRKYDKDVLGLDIQTNGELDEYVDSLTGGKCLDHWISNTECDCKDIEKDHIRSKHHGFSLRKGNGLNLSQTKNGSKNAKFPSDYFSDKELKEISKLTGTPIKNLQLKIFNEDMFEYYKRNPNEIIKICNNRDNPKKSLAEVNKWFGKYEVHRKRNHTLYKSNYIPFKKFTFEESSPDLKSHLGVV